MAEPSPRAKKVIAVANVLCVGLVLAMIVAIGVSPARHKSPAAGTLVNTGIRPFRVTGFDSRPNDPQITVEDIATHVRYRIPWCAAMNKGVGQTVSLSLETWSDPRYDNGVFQKVNPARLCPAGGA